MNDSIESEEKKWSPTIKKEDKDDLKNTSQSEDQKDAGSDRGMRETIGTWLIVLLCSTVSIVFMGWFVAIKSDNPSENLSSLKQILDVIFSPIITLLSSVIGFYFGSQTVKSALRNQTK